MSVWDALAGQEAVVSLLRTAARRGDPGQAWLIVGPAGSGRSIAAQALAATLECDSGTGCGRCEPCREVAHRVHPDVSTLSTPGLSYGVEQMRDLIPVIASRPQRGRWRVLVVEDADRLTESAANVLLKPMEEPGAATVIVLCAPAESDVLPTIRSRCRVATLRQPSTTEVAETLRSQGVPAELAAFAAAAGQGHVGRSRRLATDPAERTRRAAVLTLPAALGTLDSALRAAAELVRVADEQAAAENTEREARETAALREALGTGVRGVSARGTAAPLRELEAAQKSRATRARRDVLDRALVDLAAWYRDVLVVQFGALAEGGSVHEDQREEVAALARSSTPESTLHRIDAVLACRAAIAASVAPLLACEAMAVRLRMGA